MSDFKAEMIWVRTTHGQDILQSQKQMKMWQKWFMQTGN